MPIALIACILTLFVTSLATLFSVASASPGVLLESMVDFPLNPGFSKTFNMSMHSSTWLSIPATYSTAFGFLFGIGRQMRAMANSGLLPKFLTKRLESTHAPYAALLFACVSSYILCFCSWLTNHEFVTGLFSMAILGSYFVYICMFATYIEFKLHHTSLKRDFRNPLGIVSAYYGIGAFIVLSVSTMVFRGKYHLPIIYVSLSLLGATCYYYFYARHHQKFSPEEQSSLFNAYVINGKNLLVHTIPAKVPSLIICVCFI